MITLTPPQLPTCLLQLPQPPKKLYVSDDRLPELLQKPRIAIVGSRKLTTYGRAVTEKLASELARQGVAIISGLALGVDSVAHHAALASGGVTAAVLPAGLDKIYPSSHHNLAQQISQNNGLLISEYPPGTAPFKMNFIARNRIIAALSEGLLITEAAINSGSLHTARFSLELGKPVLAVPGPITNPMSEGTNNLIKAGAVPVTSVTDILHAMNWQQSATEPTADAHTPEEQLLLELINQGIGDGHELLIKSSLTPQAYNQALTMLEIQGRIRPLGANHWCTT